MPHTLQAAAAQPSAFAQPLSKMFPGVSPAYVSSAAIRSASMDSEASTSSPFPVAKRQCLHSLQPHTPEPECTDWHQPTQAPQQALPSTLLTHPSLVPLQHMLQQPQCTTRIPAVAAYLHQVYDLQQGALCRASNSHGSQQHPQMQQWTAEAHCAALHEQHQQPQQQQHHHHMSHQPSSLPRLQSSCCNRQGSGALPQATNSELFDTFVHQVFDIQTPPQQQQQLACSQLRQPHSEQPSHIAAQTNACNGAVISKAAVRKQATQPQQQQLLQVTQRYSASNSASSSAPQSYSLVQIEHLRQLQYRIQAQKQLALHTQNNALHQSPPARHQPVALCQQTVPAKAPSLGFAELVIFWAKGLALQRPESLHLACHLWNRVQAQVAPPTPCLTHCNMSPAQQAASTTVSYWTLHLEPAAFKLVMSKGAQYAWTSVYIKHSVRHMYALGHLA